MSGVQGRQPLTGRGVDPHFLLSPLGRRRRPAKKKLARGYLKEFCNMSEASELLQQLVAINSINPDLVPGGAGEGGKVERCRGHGPL